MKIPPLNTRLLNIQLLNALLLNTRSKPICRHNERFNNEWLNIARFNNERSSNKRSSRVLLLTVVSILAAVVMQAQSPALVMSQASEAEANGNSTIFVPLLVNLEADGDGTALTDPEFPDPDSPNQPLDGGPDISRPAKAAPAVLLATALTTESGSVNGNQPVAHLHTRDQFGADNDWFRFVKFASEGGAYQGYRSYFVPSSVDRARIESIRVETNYRGPGAERQVWTWLLFDWSNQSWTTIGDNSGAPWWGDWTFLSFDNVLGAPTDFVNSSTGEIRVMVWASNAVDSMDLDYEAVVLGLGDSGNGGGISDGIHHILVTGQSLSTGVEGYPAVAPVFPNAQRGLTWNGWQFETKRQFDPARTYPSVSLVHTLANNSAKAWAINTEGFGGATYAELMNGTDIYNQQVANVAGAYEYASARDIPYSVDALVVIHGAAEWNNANYARHLLDWQNDYAVSVEQIRGFWEQIPLFTNQMSFADDIATVHLEQLKAHLANKDIFLVGPMYQYAHVDTLHLSGPGYYHVGEVMGRVLDKVLNQGEKWEPLRPINVSTSGNTVDIRYVVPTGAIQFDTQTLPYRENFGFELLDANATIENVSIVSSDTVRLTLSRAPESSAKVSYSAGNLRDGESAVSELDGTALPNWGVVFQLSAFQGNYYLPGGEPSQPPTPPGGNEPARQTLLAETMTTKSGSISDSQGVGNLQTQDQFGADDDWNSYVKFAADNGAYQGYRSYFLPSNIQRSAITGLQVDANYRGPGAQRQIWTWRLFNWSTRSWETIGDNGAAPWWGDWTMLTFPATGVLSNFVNDSTGEIRVEVQANSTIDTMDLDYEALTIEFDNNATADTTVVYAEDDENFLNPERGFYESINVDEEAELGWVRNREEGAVSLAHAYIRLDGFRTQPLSQALLDKVERTFNAARDGGIKLVVRVAYNSPGADYQNAVDAPVEWVLTHIEQLRPLFERHSDVITVYQAGFVGAWGEWHSSSYNLTSPENRAAILTALLDAIPVERSVQLRHPEYLIDAYPTALTEAYAYSGSRWARTGHHNDCVLANDRDAGTYVPVDRGEEFRTYLDSITPWVPIGGETCHETPSEQRTDCFTTLAEFERFHWSYLNGGYYEDAIERWRTEGCHEEIAKTLGYRYRLLDATSPAAAVAGMPLSLKLRMTNDGWAGIFNPRDVVLVLRNQQTGASYRVPLDVGEVRRWLPQPRTTKTLNVDADLPQEMAAGTYTLHLELPDPKPSLAGNPDYSIRLANLLNGQTIWDAATGTNNLGITVNVNRD